MNGEEEKAYKAFLESVERFKIEAINFFYRVLMPLEKEEKVQQLFRWLAPGDEYDPEVYNYLMEAAKADEKFEICAAIIEMRERWKNSQ